MTTAITSQPASLTLTVGSQAPAAPAPAPQPTTSTQAQSGDSSQLNDAIKALQQAVNAAEQALPWDQGSGNIPAQNDCDFASVRPSVYWGPSYNPQPTGPWMR